MCGQHHRDLRAFLLGAMSQGVACVFGQRGTHVGQPSARYQTSCGRSSVWRHSVAGESPLYRPIDPPVTTMGPSGRMSDARRCWATSPDTAMTGTSHEDTSVQLETRITMIRRPAWGDVIKRALPGGRLILRRLTHQVTKATDRHEPTPGAPASPASLPRQSPSPARCRDTCHAGGVDNRFPTEARGDPAVRHTVGGLPTHSRRIDESIPDRPHLVHLLVEPDLLQ
jgi:hypothetical protein